MKPLRCIFGQHDYGDWIEKGHHMESSCRCCGHTRAKYLPECVLMADMAIDMVFRVLDAINETNRRKENQ